MAYHNCLNPDCKANQGYACVCGEVRSKKAEKRVAHAKAKWDAELNKCAELSSAYYNAGVQLREQHRRVHQAYVAWVQASIT